MRDIKYKEQYQFKVPTQDRTLNANIQRLKKEDADFSQKIGLDLSKEAQAPKDGVFDINKVKSLAMDLAENWNIPTYLVAFIANSLDQN